MSTYQTESAQPFDLQDLAPLSNDADAVVDLDATDAGEVKGGLVVIAIIAVLIGLLVPAVQKTR